MCFVKNGTAIRKGGQTFSACPPKIEEMQCVFLSYELCSKRREDLLELHAIIVSLIGRGNGQ